MTLGFDRILVASYSGRFSGMEHQILDDAAYLREQGVTVVTATRQFPDRSYYEAALQKLGVEVREFDPPPFLSEWRGRHFNRLRAFLARPSWLTPRNFDLVSVFMPWSNRGLEHIWLATRAGLPIVVSAHNSFPAKPHGTTWHKKYLHEAFAGVCGIYGVSDSALKNFQIGFGQYIRTGTVQRTVHNAIDTKRFAPTPGAKSVLCRKLGVSEDTQIVGSVGRLSPHKRPTALIDVFARVQQAYPNVHFVLVGDGELRGEVEDTIADMGLGETVTLMGQQSAVEEMMAGLDVHVLLSKIEGFGNVTAEAMASEIPVVATDVPGTEEVVEHGQTGWLVPLGDEGRAAEKVIALLTDQEMAAKMGAAGRKRTIELFGQEARRYKVMTLYREAFEAAADSKAALVRR